MNRRAFTLVELIVVTAIIGLLLGIVIPAIQHVRAAADRLRCQVNLSQIGLALHTYHTDFKRLPPQPADYDKWPNNNPNVTLSWMALILPYIDEGPLWNESVKACRLDWEAFQNPPHVGYDSVIKLYVCPIDGRIQQPQVAPGSGLPTGFTSYIANGGHLMLELKPGVLWVDFPGIRLTDIRDGLSHTFIVGERPPPDSFQAGPWYTDTWVLERQGGPNAVLFMGFIPDDPCARVTERFLGPGRTDNPCDRFHYWSLHPGGAHFLFCDGSARFLRYSARGIIPALATRAGGEPVQVPE
jgi:prepilin-type N-terminal cleavage/methylation domain-containing protein/prepilin-type processing-associated H-X9-DG protein